MNKYPLYLIIGLISFATKVPAQEMPRSTGATLVEKSYYNLIPLAPKTLSSQKTEDGFQVYLPPPKNQGALGSCVAWAVAYANRTFTESAKNPSWDPKSIDNQFSPAFTYNTIKFNTEGACDRRGMQMATALQFTQKVGAVTWSTFPYTDDACDRQPTDKILEEAAKFRIKDFASLGSSGSISIESIRKTLSDGRPVLLTIGVDREFMHNNGKIISTYSGPQYGYHAILAVGYSDSERYIKIQNSWGAAWGNDGYGKISYETAERLIYEAYVILDAAKPKPKKIPDKIDPTDTKTIDKYWRWFEAILQGNLDEIDRGLRDGLKADIEVEKSTAIELAIESGNQAILNRLLLGKPVLNTYVRHLGNYLQLSLVSPNSYESIFQLLREGLNPNILDSKGYSTMCYLKRSGGNYEGEAKIFDLLKRYGGRCISPDVEFKK